MSGGGISGWARTHVRRSSLPSGLSKGQRGVAGPRPHARPRLRQDGRMTEDQSGGQSTDPAEDAPEPVRRSAGVAESVRANRAWWDGEAEGYYSEHGRFLGDARFVWGPEGLDEAEARLLGDVTGRRVLEIGCGAAQCSRWLRGQGAQVVAS